MSSAFAPAWQTAEIGQEETTAQGCEDTSELFEYRQFWSSDHHSLISLLTWPTNDFGTKQEKKALKQVPFFIGEICTLNDKSTTFALGHDAQYPPNQF